MNIKNKLGCLIGILSVFVTLPIWFLMIFLILRHINATPLIWGLFVAYAPLTFVVGILMEVLKHIADDPKVKELVDETVTKVKPKPVNPLVKFMKK